MTSCFGIWAYWKMKCKFSVKLRRFWAGAVRTPAVQLLRAGAGRPTGAQEVVAGLKDVVDPLLVNIIFNIWRSKCNFYYPTREIYCIIITFKQFTLKPKLA